VYVPVVARDNAKRSAMRHLLQTFFDGSTSQAMSALLDVSSSQLDDAELNRLKKLIEQARKQGA
jgi:BlaI family transcriptional regulator, penicillinase repressor